MLAALLLAATLRSSSLTLIYASKDPALPGDVLATICFKQTALILITSGSLYCDLSPKMKLIILYLKGCPLGSMQLIRQTSMISLNAFSLTFVFLCETH